MKNLISLLDFDFSSNVMTNHRLGHWRVSQCAEKIDLDKGESEEEREMSGSECVNFQKFSAGRG